MFLNLAAYRFIDLDDLPALGARIDESGRAAGLKGTVLLAPEGINLFVCGQASAARPWLSDLVRDAAFGGLSLDALDAKESWSPRVVFDRWRVRIKREIITFRQPVRPADGRAQSVSSDTLRKWLDAGQDDDGRELAIVDTRNGFEVEAGSFNGAIDLGLSSFTDFPQALEPHRRALEGRRIVTFCTGGIRCEKAALWMRDAGFDHVVQLDGGVLRWFEEQQGAHWRGELFVFDQRVGLDPRLAPVAP